MCLPARLPGKELVVSSSGETGRGVLGYYVRGWIWRGSISLGWGRFECRRGEEGVVVPGI